MTTEATIVTGSRSTLPGRRTTVLLLMLVVACGHFNRVGISVAGTERIIPGNGISAKNMGLVYTAFLVFYTLAMLPGGWFIDRFGPRRALVLLGFGSTVFVALTGCVGLVFHEATGACCWAAGGQVAAGNGVCAAASRLGPDGGRPASAPSEAAQVNGWVNFSACLGIAATQLVLGALIDRFDWPVALLDFERA